MRALQRKPALSNCGRSGNPGLFAVTWKYCFATERGLFFTIVPRRSIYGRSFCEMLFHYQIHDYYLCRQSVDMRKGIDSLSGIVSHHLGKNPLSGDLFIFINRRGNQVKMLHWQGDGFALFYKRLERGTYEFSPAGGLFSGEQITAERLLFLLQGVQLCSVRKRKRYTHFAGFAVDN